MGTLFLYILTILIWGSTWLVLTFQLGEVPETWSIAWRFLLAALILHIWCFIRGKNMHFDRRTHGFFLLLGIFLFCLNYYLFYLGTHELTSGLVALIFSLMPLMNMINQRLLFKKPIQGRVLTGSLIGLAGLAMILVPEFDKPDDAGGLVYGIALCFAATLLASFGNMISLRNQEAKLPVMETNAWGMLYGGIAIALIALISGHPVRIDTGFAYMSSLAFLAVFGSVLGFGAYLTLVGRMGADKAAYCTVLFPIVALGLSTVFEDYQWSLLAGLGLATVLVGNLIVISKSKEKARLQEA